MKKQYLTFFIGLVVVLTGFFAVSVYAQSTFTPTQVKLINPIGGTEDDPEGTLSLTEIMGGVIETALKIMGSAALLMFVVGGVLWLTSAGNAERVKKGTETMVWAAIGVLIIFSSYAILSLVLGGLGADGFDLSNGSSNSNKLIAPLCMPGLSHPVEYCNQFTDAECVKDPLCANPGGKGCRPVRDNWYIGCKNEATEEACKSVGYDVCVWKTNQKEAEDLKRLIDESKDFI